jgi:hypothetical protein
MQSQIWQLAGIYSNVHLRLYANPEQILPIGVGTLVLSGTKSINYRCASRTSSVVEAWLVSSVFASYSFVVGGRSQLVHSSGTTDLLAEDMVLWNNSPRTSTCEIHMFSCWTYPHVSELSELFNSKPDSPTAVRNSSETAISCLLLSLWSLSFFSYWPAFVLRSLNQRSQRMAQAHQSHSFHPQSRSPTHPLQS